MDIKTLEYMDERVTKARKLVKRIEIINEAINAIAESDALCELRAIKGFNNSKDLLKRYEGTEDTSSRETKVELFELLKPLLLSTFELKRNKLQEELDQM